MEGIVYFESEDISINLMYVTAIQWNLYIDDVPTTVIYLHDSDYHKLSTDLQPANGEIYLVSLPDRINLAELLDYPMKHLRQT
jgi:hypothetical protein